MSDSTKLPPKRDVADALLARGSMFVHLDPRIAGTVVPAWLASQPQLVLQFGLNLPIPIPDLSVDEDGVFGTLSFQRSPFSCSIPWSSIFALVGEDGRGVVWPEDLPSEIAAEVDREVGRRAPLKPVEAIDEDDELDEERADAKGAEVTQLDARRRPSGKKQGKRGKKTELPPYLRVIK